MSDINNYTLELNIIIDKPHLYKITNLINNKYYYGVHNGNYTKLYLGSGKLLHQAYKKYGIHNFKKEILLHFDSMEEAFEYEKIVVNENMINKNNPMCYNICTGGGGGDKFTCLPIERQIEISSKRSQSNRNFMLNESIEHKEKRLNKKRQNEKNKSNEEKEKTRNKRSLSNKWAYKNMTDDQKKEKVNKRKETYQNMSNEKREEISNKIRSAYANMDTEKRKERLHKRKETFQNMSIERKKEIADKKRLTYYNKTEDELQEIKNRRSLASKKRKGKKISKQFRYFCPYDYSIIYPPSQMSKYIKINYPFEKQWNEYTKEEKINFLYTEKDINGPGES